MLCISLGSTLLFLFTREPEKKCKKTLNLQDEASTVSVNENEQEQEYI